MIRITYTSGPARPRPRVGDRRTTKKHGMQIRVLKMARDHRGRVIGLDCTGGRQRYEWVKLHELDKGDEWMLTNDEREQVRCIREAATAARLVERVALFGDTSATPTTFRGLR